MEKKISLKHRDSIESLMSDVCNNRERGLRKREKVSNVIES